MSVLTGGERTRWECVWQDERETSRDLPNQANSLLNLDDSHTCYGARSGVCIGCEISATPTDWLFGQDLPATTYPPTGNRDADRRGAMEMESSSGAGATTAAPLPEDSYSEQPTSGVTLLEHTSALQPSLETMAEDELSLLGTRRTDLFQPSNLRSSTELLDLAGQDDEAARTLNSLANWPAGLPNGEQSLSLGLFPDQETAGRVQDDLGQDNLNHNEQAGVAALADTSLVNGELLHQVDQVDVDPQNAKAYAKLVFADGDLFITTHDVMLGRNMERFEQMRRRKKQERRAREELDTYRKEPSQPSQPGDEDRQGDPSNSSLSLEGRPAPPSNFSEHGGPIWYPPQSDGEAEIQRSRPKRRISHFSKSSSTTSVAPANLHTSSISDLSNPYNEPDVRTFAFIPIHTPAAEDITKISKEHLMFSFNFQNEQWELKVVGNRAFVNEELFEKGTVVPLQHNDEIIIATIHMMFKLPDNFRQSPGLSRGTFSKESDESEVSDEETYSDARAISTSPVRRLSNAMEAELSESEEEVEPVERKAARKKPNLKLHIKPEKKRSKVEKLKTKKTSNKTHGKKPVRRESPEEESPKAMKKTHKGKKPKTEPEKKDDEDAEEEPSATAAPFIKPGSALEGIPLEELPEKRKGPGRPPKEGNVSKRDTALANKKKKEYEKRGEDPPPFKDLVTIVRRENKVKELQAKMLANGQLEPGTDILPSIEAETGAGEVGGSGARNDISRGTPTEPTRRSPPRPRRTVRALSPVKPLEECTEEDLKKPDRTYVHILDEVLQLHNGAADLPEIYERMQKRHPYFKYRCKTLGWQSSVRHNLQQSLRFKDVGKAGKGKLWSVDFDVPLEKEKKRKATPPKHPMQNGQFMPGQMPAYGQGSYGNPYGQHLPNGQPGLNPPTGAGMYYSPYAQPGASHLPGHFQNSTYPAHARPGHQHFQANGNSAPMPAPLPQHMSKLVEELIQFHGRHMSQFPPNTAEYHRQKDCLENVTEYLSAYFHDKEPKIEIARAVTSDDHRQLYEKLEKVFQRHRPDLVVPSPFLDQSAGTAGGSDQTVGTVSANPASEETATSVDSVHRSPPLATEDSSGLNLPPTEGVNAIAIVEEGAPESTDHQRQTKRAAEEDESEPDAKRQKNSDS